jgi:hypothetical protein
MVRIRRFNVVKTATVVALMYIVIVAIFAIPFLLIFGIAGVSLNGGPNVGAGLAGILIAGVFVVLVYGLLGWVFTAIACVIYNLVAGWVGGIEVEVDRVEPPPPPPAWLAPGAAPPGPPAPPAAGPPSVPVP